MQDGDLHSFKIYDYYFTNTFTMLGFLNMLRIILFMITSDIQEILAFQKQKHVTVIKPRQPWISVVIPAYNEAKSITYS